MTTPPGNGNPGGENPGGEGSGGEGGGMPSETTVGRYFTITGHNFSQVALWSLMDWQGSGFTEESGGFSQTDSSQIRMPVAGKYQASITAAALPVGEVVAESVQVGVAVNGVAGELADAVFDGTRWNVTAVQQFAVNRGDRVGVMLMKNPSTPHLSWTCTLEVEGVA